MRAKVDHKKVYKKNTYEPQMSTGIANNVPVVVDKTLTLRLDKYRFTHMHMYACDICVLIQCSELKDACLVYFVCFRHR